MLGTTPHDETTADIAKRDNLRTAHLADMAYARMPPASIRRTLSKMKGRLKVACAVALSVGLCVGVSGVAHAGAVSRLTRNIVPATETAVRHVVEKEPRDEMLDHIVKRLKRDFAP